MKIRQGDTVLVIAGKDKGKTGTVERVLQSDRRVVVSGVNIRTRHMKKTAQQAGRILRYEAGIDWSKVMIVDPKTRKPSRVGFTIKDGKKMRVSKVSGTEIAKAAKATGKPVKKVKKSKDPSERVGLAGPASEDTSKGKDGPRKENPSGLPSAQKQPFWKKMKFGAAAMEQAEVPEQSNMQKDHTIPSQEIHVRKGARGS